MPADIPSPIDLRRVEDARQWAESALSKRPWRTEFFAAFAGVIGTGAGRVLELGSGPGFLAERLLRANVALSYVALVCDHFFGEGGMADDQLHMSIAEQRQALRSAGFDRVEQIMLKGGLVLHQAT